jgi:phosphopantetheinyl transferase (holo-ACP synthase)
MVGDDVVDLADPEAGLGAQHPRFDARVFAPAERAALSASAEPGRLRWLLWAAKEAAYKLARKRDPRVIFAPARFVVTLDSRSSGRVVWSGGAARVQLRRSGSAVHATARDAGASGAFVRGVARRGTGEDPSRAARALALRRVARRLGLDPRELRVVRRGRIPVLELLRGGALDLSLSHHGGFVSFACELDGPPLAFGSLRAPLAGDPR